MRVESFWGRLALGAAAGFAGTIALAAVRSANQKWIPEATPPMTEDPGQFMVRKAKQVLPTAARDRIPPKAEATAMKLLPFAYGMAFGTAYATARPAVKRALGEGVLLGLATWAVGWLGWLPRTGLMPPVWRHTPKQIVRPLAEHALFGLATVAGYHWLSQGAKALPPPKAIAKSAARHMAAAL
jgi:hypothetical protein